MPASQAKLRVAWALADERKERLHWFHTTIWMPGTQVMEYFDWLPYD